MNRSRFIKIINTVMDEVERGSFRNVYTCNSLGRLSKKVRRDYENTFGEGYIPVFFGKIGNNNIKQARLNALTMYMIQALTFETYKDL